MFEFFILLYQLVYFIYVSHSIFHDNFNPNVQVISTFTLKVVSSKFAKLSFIPTLSFR